MRVDLSKDNRLIEKGDIVRYIGKNCLVAEELYGSRCILINLDTGVVVEGVEDIRYIRNLSGIELLAKCTEVVLNKDKQEVPF